MRLGSARLIMIVTNVLFRKVVSFHNSDYFYLLHSISMVNHITYKSWGFVFFLFPLIETNIAFTSGSIASNLKIAFFFLMLKSWFFPLLISSYIFKMSAYFVFSLRFLYYLKQTVLVIHGIVSFEGLWQEANARSASLAIFLRL